MLVPDFYIALDETLYPMRTQQTNMESMDFLSMDFLRKYELPLKVWTSSENQIAQRTTMPLSKIWLIP